MKIFDGRYSKYGGHSQWLSRLTGLDYLIISWEFGFGYSQAYYDGQHHSLKLGLIGIHWGGPPYIDI